MKLEGMMKNLKWIAFLFGFFIVPVVLAAEGIESKGVLMCSAADTAECSDGPKCVTGTSDSIEIPHFLKVDFDKKSITSADVNEERKTTEIVNQQKIEDRIILQGIQGGLGWSMSINAKTGDMVLTASGDEVGFVVLGECTPL